MRRAALLLLALPLSACVSYNQTTVAPAVAAAPAPTGGDAPAPDSMRWLYGSGEAAAVSIQTWRQIADYATAVSRQRKVPQSVPMGLPGAPGGIGTPSCQKADGTQKPFAAVFDVDETSILNTGYEYWSASGHPYNQSEFAEWAREGAPYVLPVPGAVTGVRRLREAGITVIFNTNRLAKNAAGTAAALDAAGLGPVKHGETLFLNGDDDLAGNKDGRRAIIASRFCVIALGGDNLGDFAEVLNDSKLDPQQRRARVARGEIAQLWGNGWFALPNPVYGPAVRGTVDQVFPPAVRWTPGTEGK